METDDQAILAKAKKANEFAADMKATVEEMAADESIEPGIGSIDEVPTTTSLEENDGKRTIHIVQRQRMASSNTMVWYL